MITQEITAHAGGSCARHRHHHPEPVTFEEHHIIPQAWQAAWRPEQTVIVGPVPDKERIPVSALWDRRTEVLCATGHRNLHHWIVMLMQQVGKGATVEQAVKAVKPRADKEIFELARQALVRFEAAGGNLGALVAAGQLGWA